MQVTQASQPDSNYQPPANGAAEPPAEIAPIAAEVLPAAQINWTERPESVVLIVFVSLLMLWQFYLDLLEDEDGSLSSSKLAQRLGVSYSTVRRRRLREDFAEWSRSHDPDAIGWMYRGGRFVPIG